VSRDSCAVQAIDVINFPPTEEQLAELMDVLAFTMRESQLKRDEYNGRGEHCQCLAVIMGSCVNYTEAVSDDSNYRPDACAITHSFTPISRAAAGAGDVRQR